MVTLYYLNKNNDIETMEIPNFDTCINLFEPVFFIAFRDGLNFIKNPPANYPFTNLERLVISTEFFDMNFIKDSDFRKQNTKFCPQTYNYSVGEYGLYNYAFIAGSTACNITFVNGDQKLQTIDFMPLYLLQNQLVFSFDAYDVVSSVGLQFIEKIVGR